MFCGQTTHFVFGKSDVEFCVRSKLLPVRGEKASCGAPGVRPGAAYPATVGNYSTLQLVSHLLHDVKRKGDVTRR